METINSTNYELYFIDYLDGKLSAAQVKELNAFVLLNPDLQEELNMLLDNDSLLSATDIVLSKKEKEQLKKNISLDLDSHLHANDNIVISILEKDLEAIDLNIELKKELEEYKKTIFKSDTNIVFKYKQELKQVMLPSDTNIIFENKNGLKKEDSFKLLNNSNQINVKENIIIAYLEGDLSESEKIKFEKELKINKSTQHLFSAFAQTKLQANDNIIFPYKKDLKKNETKIIPLFYKLIAIAAMLVMVLFIGKTFLFDTKKIEIATLNKKSNNNLALVTSTNKKTVDNNLATKAQKIINTNSILEKINSKLGNRKLKSINNKGILIPVEFKNNKQPEQTKDELRIAKNTEKITLPKNVIAIDSIIKNAKDESLVAYNNDRKRITSIGYGNSDDEDVVITTIKADDIMKQRKREENQNIFSKRNIIKRLYKTFTNDTLQIEGDKNLNIESRLFAFSK